MFQNISKLFQTTDYTCSISLVHVLRGEQGNPKRLCLEAFLNCAFIWDTSFIINEKSWKLKEIFKSFLPLLSKTNFPQLIYDEFNQIFAVHSFGTFHSSLSYHNIYYPSVTKVNRCLINHNQSQKLIGAWSITRFIFKSSHRIC